MQTLIRIQDAADPERCQAVNKDQQCPYKRVQDSDYCLRHGGRHASEIANKEGVRNYQLAVWRDRVNKFSDNPNIKSLREEIGILRLLIENILNRCKDSHDLMLFSDRISDLIIRVEKVVASCHKLEERTGMLLDKQTIIIVADSLVKIIGNYIEDPDELQTIAGQMIEVVAKIGGLEDVTENARPV